MLTTQTAHEASDQGSSAARGLPSEADGRQLEVARVDVVDAQLRAGSRAAPPPPSPPPPPVDVSAIGHAFAAGQGPWALDWMRSDGLAYLQRKAGNRAVASLVARRRSLPIVPSVPAGTTAPTVARAVIPTFVRRLGVADILGDGTPARRGMLVHEFDAYMSRRADWFADASITAADRDRLWAVANLLGEGSHVSAALHDIRVRDIAFAPPADIAAIRGYAEGGKSPATTVRITQPHADFARVKQLGNAMLQLGAFVPGPVLQIVINQDALEKLVDEGLIPVLRTYYVDFTPTLETPDELAPLLALLRAGIAPFAPLKDWVHDLHHLTRDTLVRLVANVADNSRAHPVMLVLMSGLDWNASFLQSMELETAVKNPANLALVLQGSTSLANETARVNKIADDYGQIPPGQVKGRLGQVVFAGHGQSTSVEQTTTGAGATVVDNKFVKYGKADLHPAAPGDDSEKLIDAVLSRMNPADARVVFAGCLVGSHDIPEHPDLKTKAKAAKAINAAITNDPNLRDLVQKRMKVLKVKGKVEASNASTTEGSFKLDAAGKGRLSLLWDPDLGGPKAKYVKTGAEPEGALRAALETWADPKLGPAWTTKQMRDHVAAAAGTNHWWKSLTRTAFKIALPPAGDVDPAVLANLAHRVGSWLNAGWKSTVSVGWLVNHLTPAEAPDVFATMLASDHNTPAYPHLPIVVQVAWMWFDPAHEAAFMAALGPTPLKRSELANYLWAPVVNPRLPTALATVDPLTPTRAQLLLALTIAVELGAGMPAPVKTLLRNAAGGKKTMAFPAALNVPELLDGAAELEVLRSIGLAQGAAAGKGGGGGPVAPDEANVDVNGDGFNETFVAVAPKSVRIGQVTKYIRAGPSNESLIIGTLLAGGVLMPAGYFTGQKTIQVVGTAGTFTAVDLNGTIGFVDGKVP